MNRVDEEGVAGVIGVQELQNGESEISVCG
jgi:hypothetical protein